MDDKVVSFRLGKKRVARAAKETAAQENRVKFGRTKLQKQSETFAKSKAAKHIDDHKREP